MCKKENEMIICGENSNSIIKVALEGTPVMPNLEFETIKVNIEDILPTTIGVITFKNQEKL
jgi:hypothetical protein